MKEELIRVNNNNIDVIKDSQVVKLLFSSSYEKYKGNERILNEAPELTSTERVNALNKNYNCFRTEIIENILGVVAVSALVNIVITKREYLATAIISMISKNINIK